jgi:hypothetical protein
MEPTKSAMYQDCRPMAGSGAGLVGGACRLFSPIRGCLEGLM